MYYTVYDLETNGLSPFSEVLQFAYVILDESFNHVKSESLYFYKEGLVIPKEASDVNGLTVDFLKQFEDQYETNLIKMYSHLQRGNLVTFNGDKFDNVVATNFLARNGLPDLKIEQSYDMMKIIAKVTHGFKKLTTAVSMVGIPNQTISMMCKHYFGYDSHAHDGGYDVTMTALLLIEASSRNLISKLENKVITYEERQILESDMWMKGYFDEEDFSSMKFIKVTEKDGYTHFYTECSDKKKYAFLKLNKDEAMEAMRTNKYENKTLPVKLVDSLIKAMSSKPYVYESDGLYVYKFTDNMSYILTNSGSACSVDVSIKNS